MYNNILHCTCKYRIYSQLPNVIIMYVIALPIIILKYLFSYSIGCL